MCWWCRRRNKNTECPVFALPCSHVWLLVWLILQSTFNREFTLLIKASYPTAILKHSFLWLPFGSLLEGHDWFSEMWRSKMAVSVMHVTSLPELLLKRYSRHLMPVYCVSAAFYFAKMKWFHSSDFHNFTWMLHLWFQNALPHAHTRLFGPSHACRSSHLARHIILITEPSLSALTHFSAVPYRQLHGPSNHT